MIRKAKYLAAALMAAALFVAPSGFHTRANAQEARARRALDFSLKDINGHAIKLSQWRGHPVVIDFWATWCPPCRKQIPELKKLYSQYRDSRGLVVLGIACDTVQGDGLRAIRPFVKQFSINYPVLLAETDVLDLLRVEAIPTTVFVAADGSVVGRMMGSGAPGELTEGVSALLAKPGGKAGPAKKRTPAEEKKENLYDIEFRK